MIWYNNSNGVPVILATSLTSQMTSSSGMDANTAIKYVGFYCALSQSICWTLGRALIVPSTLVIPLGQLENTEAIEGVVEQDSLWKKMWSVFKLRLVSTIAPVLMGMAFGIASKYTAPLFVADGAPLRFIWSVLDILAKVAIPLPSLTLGCVLYLEKFSLRTRLKSSVIVSLCRLMLVPFGSFLLLYTCPMRISSNLKVVMMIEAVTPTANNVIMMMDCPTGSDLGRDVARIMLFEYIVSVFSVTLWLTVF
jgi:hypothetical protein